MSSGIDWYHSSEFANTGSTSNTTPRNANNRWRTTSPMPNRALVWRGAMIVRPAWLKKEYDGYPDEYWVKFWKKDWKEIIYGNDASYTKKLLNAGFDGAYLDDVFALIESASFEQALFDAARAFFQRYLRSHGFPEDYVSTTQEIDGYLT